jgi:hypothetical protein
MDFSSVQKTNHNKDKNAKNKKIRNKVLLKNFKMSLTFLNQEVGN